jgi:hypothetical protein
MVTARNAANRLTSGHVANFRREPHRTALEAGALPKTNCIVPPSLKVSPSLLVALLRTHQAEEFGADLVETTFVGFAFLVENGGDFGAGFDARLGLLLDLDVDHFFQQA